MNQTAKVVRNRILLVVGVPCVLALVAALLVWWLS